MKGAARLSPTAQRRQRFRPLAGKWDESSIAHPSAVSGVAAVSSFRPLAGKWDESGARHNLLRRNRRLKCFRPLAGKWDESSQFLKMERERLALEKSFRPLAGKWDESATRVHRPTIGIQRFPSPCGEVG
jgi:hypothetical protein